MKSHVSHQCIWTIFFLYVKGEVHLLSLKIAARHFCGREKKNTSMTSEHKKATKRLVFSFTYQRSYSSSIGEWRAIAAWMKIIHVLKRKDEKVLVSMLFLPEKKGVESTYRGYQEGLIDALIVLY